MTWVSPTGFRSERKIPFVPRSGWELDLEGNFWVAETGSGYAIRHEGPRGDTLLVIERQYEPVPIPYSVRERVIDEYRREGWTPEGGFAADDVPRHYAPFEALHVATDGLLWVRRQFEVGLSGFDVFTPEGHYRGAVELPENAAGVAIHMITQDAVYGTVRDEWGVLSVVRLSIPARVAGRGRG